jgi:hypothetical protein
MRMRGDRFVIDAVRWAMYEATVVSDRNPVEIGRVTLAMYRHTFEIDRDLFVIDGVTLAMSVIAVVVLGNAGAWF